MSSVDKRLTAELIGLYTGNYSDNGVLLPGSPSDDSRGMVLFGDLRMYQQKLQAVRGLVVATQATTGYEATAAALYSQYNELKGSGEKVSSFILQMVIARAVKVAVEGSEYRVVVALLNPESTCEHGLKVLDAEDSKKLQKSLLTEIILNLLKIEPEKAKEKAAKEKGTRPCFEASSKVASVIVQVRELFSELPWDALDAYILDANFREELVKLNALSSAASLTDPEAIDKAAKSREDLICNKNGTFYRGLTIFATGIALRLEADKHFEKAQADKAHAVVLEHLSKQAPNSINS